MVRYIVETEKIDENHLTGVIDRLEGESDSQSEIWETGTGAEKILRYKFDEDLGNGDNWYGQVDIEIYDGDFRARGDEALVSDYFAPNQVQELKLE